MTQFTYRKVTEGRAFDAGCRGMISTAGMLTAEQVERLRVFWETKRGTIEDGDKFLLPSAADFAA